LDRAITDSQCEVRLLLWAIVNASAGDWIQVGPGRYGDLDENGFLTGVGEESGACGAAICVNKTLNIVSREGAVRTVIDLTNVQSPRNALIIRADDVVFGRSNRGFTVRGAPNVGVEVEGSRISIVDNIAIGNEAAGFALQAGVPNDCHLFGNQAIDNGSGFFVVGDGHLLEFNVALSNRGAGFVLAGHGQRFYDNQSIGNGGGIDVNGGGDVRIVHNAFIGNLQQGLKVLNQTFGLAVVQNNFFGNGTRFDAANLGLLADPGPRVNATNNFWGAATGPGPDPADQVTGDVRFVPFATKPFTMRSLNDVR